MLYTVGHTKSYLDYIKSSEMPTKLGRDQAIDKVNHKGGIVFRTIAEAQLYIKEVGREDEWSVFGLDCDEDNTYLLDLDNTYRIINNTLLIILPDQLVKYDL